MESLLVSSRSPGRLMSSDRASGLPGALIPRQRIPERRAAVGTRGRLLACALLSAFANALALLSALADALELRDARLRDALVPLPRRHRIRTKEEIASMYSESATRTTPRTSRTHRD